MIQWPTWARQARRPVDKVIGLRNEQSIVLTGPKTSHEYQGSSAASATSVPGPRRGSFSLGR